LDVAEVSSKMALETAAVYNYMAKLLFGVKLERGNQKFI